MKKYNIFDLKVVELKTNNKTRYFICKNKGNNNTYVEIFTNDKIKIDDESKVRPFSDYYSILAQCNYKTGKPLMLDKKQILQKYLDINNDYALEKNEEQQNNNTIYPIGNNKKLDKATINFFPKEGKWYSDCFRKSQELNMLYLPCNLRNDEWLAAMLRKDQNLFYISYRKVLDYVRNSQFFKEKRHEYELEIVKWQINWIVTGGENWIVDEKLGGDFVYIMPTVDLGIRKGVVDTLSKIGMNKDVIEEGIEINADLWRDSSMLRAFNNEYNSVFDIAFYGNSVEEPSKEHQEKWLKMRKYEYYQRHKDSVDKYGSVEPDMLMSDEKIVELKKYLDEKHEERMAYLEEIKKNDSKKHIKICCK